MGQDNRLTDFRLPLAIMVNLGKPAPYTRLDLNDASDLLVVYFWEILDVIVFQEDFGFANCPAFKFKTIEQLYASVTIGNDALLETKCQEAIPKYIETIKILFMIWNIGYEYTFSRNQQR